MKSGSTLRYLTTTELSCRKWFILTVYGVAIVILAIRWIAMTSFSLLEESPERTASQMEISMWITIAAGAFVTHGLFSGIKRQRRDRLLAPLAVLPRTVIWSRILAVLSIHLLTVLIWLAGYLLVRTGIPAGFENTLSVATLPSQLYKLSFWTPLSLLAIGIYVSLVVALAHVWRKTWWGNILFWVVAVVFTNLLVYPAGSSPGVFVLGYSIFNTGWGTLYYVSIAVAVAHSIVIVYRRGTVRG